MMNRQMLKAVVAVLKKRFNNLSAEELIELGMDIIQAIESNLPLVEVKKLDHPLE